MRTFIRDDQWIERVTDGPDWGYRYYDGVHRGFVRAGTSVRLGERTEAEMDDARADAVAACNRRWEYAHRR